MGRGRTPTDAPTLIPGPEHATSRGKRDPADAIKLQILRPEITPDSPGPSGEPQGPLYEGEGHSEDLWQQGQGLRGCEDGGGGRELRTAGEPGRWALTGRPTLLQEPPEATSPTDPVRLATSRTTRQQSCAVLCFACVVSCHHSTTGNKHGPPIKNYNKCEHTGLKGPLFTA